MKTSNTRWYHQTLLAVCVVVAAVIGVSDVVGGSARQSRFHAIDDVFVRLLGVAFLLFAVALGRRKSIGFLGVGLCCVLSMIEVAVTYVPAAGANARTQLGALLLVQFFVFSLPVIVLIWLHRIYIPPKPDQPPELNLPKRYGPS
jgi:hypothetical protein